jgi:hypothetical protein
MAFDCLIVYNIVTLTVCSLSRLIMCSESKELQRMSLPRFYPTNAARQAAYRQRRIARGLPSGWNQQQPRSPCVYMVQLMQRMDCFKVGQTVRLARRLVQLRMQYGQVRCILVVPCEHPRPMEKAIHAQLTAFRVYEDANPSELFQFKTARARKAVAALLTTYAPFIVGTPAWSKTAKQSSPIARTDQMGLWG